MRFWKRLASSTLIVHEIYLDIFMSLLRDFSAYNKDSSALSAFLLEKALVVTVPGGEFGLEGHLRLSYCGSINEITEGIARIKWALDPDSPNEIYIGDRKLRRDWK
jgi:aspartate aminotransferase